MYLTSFIHRNALFNIAERWFCNRPEPGDVKSLTEILICDGFVIHETLAVLTKRLIDMTCHSPFYQQCIRSKGELRDMICSDDRNAQPRVVDLLKAAGTPAILVVEDNPDKMTTIGRFCRIDTGYWRLRAAKRA